MRRYLREIGRIANTCRMTAFTSLLIIFTIQLPDKQGYDSPGLQLQPPDHLLAFVAGNARSYALADLR